MKKLYKAIIGVVMLSSAAHAGGSIEIMAGEEASGDLKVGAPITEDASLFSRTRLDESSLFHFTQGQYALTENGKLKVTGRVQAKSGTDTTFWIGGCYGNKGDTYDYSLLGIVDPENEVLQARVAGRKEFLPNEKIKPIVEGECITYWDADGYKMGFLRGRTGFKVYENLDVLAGIDSYKIGEDGDIEVTGKIGIKVRMK